MSKYVKNLITEHLRQRLTGVNDALVVNMIGLGATADTLLRAELRKKNIQVVVVKNSLAARATAGTALAPLFDGVTGTAAICWGAEDIVSLAKQVTQLVKDVRFPAFTARAGVMDGQRLNESQVADVSKWPSRTEQLSLLVGQILSPGANLLSQLTSAGGALASQIEQKSQGDEAAPAAEDAAAPAAEAAAGETAAAPAAEPPAA